MGHSHINEAEGSVLIARLPRNIMLALIGLATIFTGIGLVVLWPNYDKVSEIADNFQSQSTAPGVTFPEGEITAISESCEDTPYDSGQIYETAYCKIADVLVISGAKEGQTVQILLYQQAISSELVVGDRVKLISVPDDYSAYETDGSVLTPSEIETSEYFYGIVRNNQLLVLVIVFVAVVVVVARLRGFLALISLTIAGIILIGFLLPALLSGGPGLFIAIVGASAIMLVVLYIAHGFSIRTTVALAGTLCGIVITGLIAEFSVGFTRLSGIIDEVDAYLAGMSGGMSLRGLLTCGIIIAGLGVLNDVTITQASSMWQLREVAPQLTRTQLFQRGMKIGRDHIASTIYTIVFAYAGAAMSILLLLYLYNRPMLELLSEEEIASEIVRTLCSSIGMILAVPITTGIAALMIPPQNRKQGKLRSPQLREKDEYTPWSVTAVAEN